MCMCARLEEKKRDKEEEEKEEKKKPESFAIAGQQTWGGENISRNGMSPSHCYKPRICHVMTSIAQAYSQHPALEITGSAVQQSWHQQAIDVRSISSARNGTPKSASQP